MGAGEKAKTAEGGGRLDYRPRVSSPARLPAGELTCSVEVCAPFVSWAWSGARAASIASASDAWK
jgi:hypothetical protein